MVAVMKRRKRHLRAVPEPVSIDPGELKEMVAKVIGIPPGELCNYALIGLTHPKHQVIVVAPGKPRMVHLFLEKAARDYEKDVL
jgi:hypothetical protein